jgi:hypothetical protein
MIRATVSRVALGLLLALGLAAPARAVPRPPVNAPGVLDWGALSLSTDQIRKINLLRLEFQRSAIRLRADIELRRVDIDRLMTAPNADANRLRALLREKTELQADWSSPAWKNFLPSRPCSTPTTRTPA